MSETIPSNTEDPLPTLPVVDGYGPDNELDLPSTLGEVVSMDDRDPFRWYSKMRNPNKPLTNAALQYIWDLYRLVDGVPESAEDAKDHDKYIGKYTIDQLSQSDLETVYLYERFLTNPDAPQQYESPYPLEMPVRVAKLDTPIPVIHDAQGEAMLMGMFEEHFRIVYNIPKKIVREES